MKKKPWRTAAFAAFLCYLAVMLYLLFFQRMGHSSYMEYWERVRISLNLVPFHTISQFWGNLSSERDYIVRRAFINLAGNIAMFIPIGLFLPYFWEKQRRFRCFLPTVILTIVCVEVIQLFTLLGACDIDDLIFNTLGASAGFVIFSVFRPILAKRGNDNQ